MAGIPAADEIHSVATARPRLLSFVLGLVLAALAAHVVYSLLPGGGPELDAFFNDWVYNGIFLGAAFLCAARAVASRADRAAWSALGAALAIWAAAEITFSVFDPEGYPSLSDGLWLGFYPACYAGLVLLVRARAREFSSSLWLDGLLASLAAAALGAAVLFEVVLESTGGSAATVVTNLAYPLGDILLFALVLGVFALCGWRPGRAWTLIGVSFLLTAVADGIYLYEAAAERYHEGTILDSLWPASALALGLAAWQPDKGRRLSLTGRTVLVVPAVLGLIAIGVLVSDHVERLNPLAVGLAGATLLAVIVRATLTFRENLAILARIRTQAVTDELTGIGNRRRLLEDLEDALADGHGQESILLLFDLDGFKRYNDTYGHPAGDVLLARLGGKLAAAVAGAGAAYRLGGDEFCVLASLQPGGHESLIDSAAAALVEEGEAFSVGASLGAVFVPGEATTSAQALRIADQRLYASKQGRRAASGRHPEDLLLRALYEAEPELHEHAQMVAGLARALGERLALSPEELVEVGRAAELHDIGKLAIPETILRKPGPLDEQELEFVHRHTAVGERILSASPALAGVARLVRSSHERWDGAGYPDGVAGEEIPLGGRIIAVCEAFSAMVTDHPYRNAMTPEALAEIRRCAGTQFDPGVAAAFVELVASQPPATALTA
jgi:two-component system cell cycle response regulator